MAPRRLLASLRYALPAACLLALGCSGDDDSAGDPDAQPLPPDANIPDAAADADPGPCPGQLPLEAFVQDLVTGTAEFEVTVTDATDSNNTASSAPNGRADLCLGTGVETVLEVTSTKDGFVTRHDTLLAEAVASLNDAVLAYPLAVIGIDPLDSLFEQLGLERDAAAAQVILTVISADDGTPVEGAELAIDLTSDGAFAEGAAGAFDAGSVTAEGGTILIANADVGTATVTFTPPAAFSGTCTGPTTATLVAGAITGLVWVCTNG